MADIIWREWLASPSGPSSKRPGDGTSWASVEMCSAA